VSVCTVRTEHVNVCTVRTELVSVCTVRTENVSVNFCVCIRKALRPDKSVKGFSGFLGRRASGELVRASGELEGASGESARASGELEGAS
jgi:hypothetical protein